jgi:hypothetical protein
MMQSGVSIAQPKPISFLNLTFTATYVTHTTPCFYLLELVEWILQQPAGRGWQRGAAATHSHSTAARSASSPAAAASSTQFQPSTTHTHTTSAARQATCQRAHASTAACPSHANTLVTHTAAVLASHHHAMGSPAAAVAGSSSKA